MDIRSVSGIQANRPTPASAVPPPQSAADAVADAATQTSQASSNAGASPSDPVVVAGGYISPVLRYDQGARLAVIYFRDRSSGETQNQIPAPQVVEEYRRTASRLGGATDAAADGGTGKEAKASGGTAAPGGADRSAAPGFGPSMPSGSPSAEATPATGAGAARTAPAAVSPAAGSYGAGSPGAIVSVTV